MSIPSSAPLRTLVRALLCLALPIVAAAQTPPTPFNLALEGSLPGATQLQVGNAGVKGSETVTLTLPAGKLDQGITIALGKPRALTLRALNADGKEIYRGEAVVDATKSFIPQVGVEFRSVVEGAPAALTLASHKLSVEFAAIDRDGKPFTRLTGQVFDANGARFTLKDGDLSWGFNDPKFQFQPCPILSGKPPLCVEFEPIRPDPLLSFDVCLRKGICKFQYVPPTPPVWRSVAVGFDDHACALRVDGRAYCWGNGEHGQLGYPAPKNCSVAPGGVPTPWGCSQVAAEVQCAPGSSGCGFTQISAGKHHTCALDGNQDAWCWGGNYFGERGTGGTDSTEFGSPVPQRVAGGLKFTEIRAAWHSTCGLTTTHEVFCWGHNINAIVPASTSIYLSSPTRVTLPAAVEKLDATWANACATIAGGDLYCWGTNAYRVLGTASFAAAPNCINCPASPLRMQNRITALTNQRVSLIASGSYGSCAHLGNNQTTCWGQQPVAVLAPTAVSKLSFGFRHFCGVANKVAQCSGAGAMGDGNYDPTNGYGPVRPTAPKYVRDIDTGNADTCALGEDERVYCWGGNDFGGLGNGEIGIPSYQPVPVQFPVELQTLIKLIGNSRFP